MNLSVPGTSVGTITNEEGEFSIKVRNSLRAAQVELSHIGYFNDLIKVEGKNLSDYTVWLEPNTNSLAEVIVRADDPREIVKEALAKVGDNYVATGNMLTGFYRETAQKGRRYINIFEAIIDIYKTSYANRNVDRDRVQIYKGRKLLSQKTSDTLAIKLYGKLFIDKERLSFSSAEFRLSMDDQMKATEAILRRKPLGLRFKPLEVAFLATYKEQDGVSRLSYIRNEVRFKCDWKRKLFSTNYTVVSEMVVTDGREETNGIPYRMAFKADQSLSDKVLDFADEQFWGAYNIIEPTESLANAVHKLKKQQQ